MDTVTLQLEQTTNEYVPFSLNSPATNNGRLEYFEVSSTTSTRVLYLLHTVVGEVYKYHNPVSIIKLTIGLVFLFI